MAAAETAIRLLIKGAGKDAAAALMLLQTIFVNIKNNPKEAKYRSLNLESSRIKNELLCHPGATDFLAAAGFVKSAEGALVLGVDAGVAFNDALSVLTRHFAALSDHHQRRALGNTRGNEEKLFREAVEGGARNAGLSEVETLCRSQEGTEAMQLLEKVLANIRRFPGNPQYKSVKLSGKAGRKLRVALPLAQLAGFEVRRDASTGEDRAELNTFNADIVERVAKMLQWATNATAKAIDLKSCLAMPSQHASLAAAAVLGAAVGDALGAPLGNDKRFPLNALEVDKAFEMCGGGDLQLAPGQVTDATELVICLAEALQATPSTTSLPREDISQMYCEWGATKPFALKPSTKNVFSGMCASTDLARRALRTNSHFESNEALMRCTPLAAWCLGRGLRLEQVADAAREDARFSHPNFALVEASAAYTVAVSYLVQYPGDRSGALKAVVDMLACEKQRKKENAGAAELGAFDVIEDWLKQAVGSEHISCELPETDAAQIAFTLAFRHLHLGSSFEVAMRATICGGGDTDTNASVVGGLVGAAVGLSGIPERWLRAVLACNLDIGAQPRPDRFHPRRLPDLVRRLCTLNDIAK